MIIGSKAIVVLAIVSVVVFGLLTYFIDRSPPAEFIGGAIEPQEITAGTVARISRSVRWDRACPNIVTRYVKDSKGYQHKIGQFVAPVPDMDKCRAETLIRDKKPACIVNSFNPFPVSAGLSPGPAEYHVEVDFYCGLIGKVLPIQVTAPVLTFVVK